MEILNEELYEAKMEEDDKPRIILLGSDKPSVKILRELKSMGQVILIQNSEDLIIENDRNKSKLPLLDFVDIFSPPPTRRERRAKERKSRKI